MLDKLNNILSKRDIRPYIYMRVPVRLNAIKQYHSHQSSPPIREVTVSAPSRSLLRHLQPYQAHIRPRPVYALVGLCPVRAPDWHSGTGRAWCVCVLFILYSLCLEYDKIHSSPILRSVTQSCLPVPPLGHMYHPFLLPPITSHINWPPFLEYNLHIPSSDDNDSKNPCSYLVKSLFDVIAVEYPNHLSTVLQDI